MLRRSSYFNRLTGIRVYLHKLQPSNMAGRIYLGLGLLYALIMVIRLVLGLTLLKTHFWFSAYIPTLFHLVLASFVLTLGYYHYRNTNKI